MKKIKREIEPIVFRSLRTPGLEGQRGEKEECVCVEKNIKKSDKTNKKIK